MKVETATHAKLHFGRILEEAGREPVLIQKSGRNVAVLLSYEEYQQLLALEDQYWAQKAKKAEKEGFVGTKAGEKLLGDILDVDD